MTIQQRLALHGSKAPPNAPRNNAMKDTLFGRGDFWGIGSYLVPHPGTPATRTNHDQLSVTTT